MSPSRGRAQGGGGPGRAAVDGTPRLPRERYPVLEERSLGRPDRGWLRGERRRIEELPQLQPGCVYVFGSNGHYEQSSASTHLTGREQELIGATSVSVVDIRPRQVTTHLMVPSATPANDFVVKVNFGCEVETATEVARQNLTDLRAELQAQLKQDPNLLEFQHSFYPDEIDEVRRQVVAYMLAAYRQRPPRIRGMRIWLHDVEVQTPRELRHHAARIRDKNWRIAEDHIDRRAERHWVDHNEDLLSSRDRAMAAAVARGDMDAARVAEMRHEEDQRRAELLHEQYTQLVQSGAINRMPVEQLSLAEAAIAQLLGRPAPPQRQAPAPEAIANRRSRRDRAEPNADADVDADEPELYIASDDELDDDLEGRS